MGRNRANYSRLYKTVSDQQGYFTAKQAKEAGYADNTHPFHVKAGNWTREHRGIYRLAKYPWTEHPDMALWALWSHNRKGEPQGVYSHDTALSLHEISDLNPAKLHMTVPPAFRRNSPPPKILLLHRDTIHPDDFQAMQGFRVTRPLRAIAELLAEGATSMDFMEQAVKEAAQRGLIYREKIRNAERISEDVKKQIEKFLSGP